MMESTGTLIGGGHMTDTPNEESYSSVVTIKSLIICILLAELNGQEILVRDVGNAYLEAKPKKRSIK